MGMDGCIGRVLRAHYCEWPKEKKEKREKGRKWGLKGKV